MSYNSHEFRLQAAVLELLTRLDVPTDKAERVAQTLSSSISSTSSASSSSLSSAATKHQRRPSGQTSTSQATYDTIRQLAERAAAKAGGGSKGQERKAAVMKLFEKLKAQQIYELEPFVEFLKKVVDDPSVVGLLGGGAGNAGSDSASPTSSGTAAGASTSTTTAAQGPSSKMSGLRNFKSSENLGVGMIGVGLRGRPGLDPAIAGGLETPSRPFLKTLPKAKSMSMTHLSDISKVLLSSSGDQWYCLR
jgi:hypothetical protein